jgi:hypothetical protein
MWRKTALVVGFTGLLLTVVVGGWSWSKSASSDNVRGRRMMSFQLHATIAADVIDVGDPGTSVGDEVITSGRVLQRWVDEVGFFGQVCTATQESFRRVICSTTVVLSGRGRLVLEGTARTQTTRRVEAVTGGTGEFRNARGQAWVTPISAATTKVRVLLIE